MNYIVKKEYPFSPKVGEKAIFDVTKLTPEFIEEYFHLIEDKILTSDGFEIKGSDELLFLVTKGSNMFHKIDFVTYKKSFSHILQEYETFKHEDNAHKYIEENKLQYSKLDLEKAVANALLEKTVADALKIAKTSSSGNQKTIFTL